MRSIDTRTAGGPSPPAIVAGYVRLIHPAPVLFVMLGTALFGLLAAGGWPDLSRFLLMLAAMLGGQVAIGAHNEWRDRVHDAIHQPWKPIPARLVNPRLIRPIIAGSLLVGIGAGAALGFWPLVLWAVGTASGFVYNIRLKRTPLSGLPYLVSLPLLPIWATLVMDGFEPRLLWLYPLGGAYVLAIHLAQSMSDIEGDDASGTRGLAVVLGERRARRVIWGIAIGTALIMPVGGWLFGSRPIYALAGAGLAGTIFAGATILQSRREKDLDGILMETLAAGAIALAIGWFLAVTG